MGGTQSERSGEPGGSVRDGNPPEKLFRANPSLNSPRSCCKHSGRAGPSGAAARLAAAAAAALHHSSKQLSGSEMDVFHQREGSSCEVFSRKGFRSLRGDASLNITPRLCWGLVTVDLNALKAVRRLRSSLWLRPLGFASSTSCLQQRKKKDWVNIPSGHAATGSQVDLLQTLRDVISCQRLPTPSPGESIDPLSVIGGGKPP